MSIGAGKPLGNPWGRAYADQHTLDPTTSSQLLPPFAREMTCQVYDSALGAWGCLIPAFESTLPGRLSPPFTPLSSKSSLTSLPARFMIVPFDFGLPGCAHALYGGSIRRATPRAGSPRPCRQSVGVGLESCAGNRLADYPCWSMDPTHGGLVERVARLERLRLTYILMANGGEV